MRAIKNSLGQSEVLLPALGLYHYERRGAHERARVHLRVDADGRGTLIVNANRIMHLNASAAVMAHLHLQGATEEEALRSLRSVYRVGKNQARSDYVSFTNNLDELLRPDGACPFHDLNVDVAAPFSARPSAPYRMDLALTYRCNNVCSHCYNPAGRAAAELTTTQWKAILERLWEIGIPHIIFTGGEPTLRDDLAELIQHAEGNGQITGLNTNGRRLCDAAYLQSLVDAGLDHVQITLESHDAAIHDHMVQRSGAWEQTVAGIRNCLNSSLYVMTNTTLLRENACFLAQTLDYLADLGVPTLGLNALIYAGRGKEVGTGLDESELPALLKVARQRTQAHDQRLIWYTPTEYCRFDPVQLELGVKGCTAALYNMCVEPDGTVIPCQSAYQPVGDIRRDEWDRIWNHELCVHLRERRYAPAKCRACALLVECGGGCPLKMSAKD